MMTSKKASMYDSDNGVEGDGNGLQFKKLLKDQSNNLEENKFR